jgi:hypothetical protein
MVRQAQGRKLPKPRAQEAPSFASVPTVGGLGFGGQSQSGGVTDVCGGGTYGEAPGSLLPIGRVEKGGAGAAGGDGRFEHVHDDTGSAAAGAGAGVSAAGAVTGGTAADMTTAASSSAARTGRAEPSDASGFASGFATGALSSGAGSVRDTSDPYPKVKLKRRSDAVSRACVCPLTSAAHSRARARVQTGALAESCTQQTHARTHANTHLQKKPTQKEWESDAGMVTQREQRQGGCSSLGGVQPHLGLDLGHIGSGGAGGLGTAPPAQHDIHDSQKQRQQEQQEPHARAHAQEQQQQQQQQPLPTKSSSATGVGGVALTQGSGCTGAGSGGRAAAGFDTAAEPVFGKQEGAKVEHERAQQEAARTATLPPLGPQEVRDTCSFFCFFFLSVCASTLLACEGE